METIWFWLVAFMITMYVVLDGFDLGAGIVHPWVARSESERRLVLRSIGPVWDGNEVWLLAAGGTLYFAFPVLYASSFSGFYLPLIIVLWLLILRGIAIEFRNQLDSPTWAPFWDVVFSFASLLLAVFYGAAIGNVVRGVPLDGNGYFFEPLWTDFRLGRETGILDWYTILVGLTAFLTLTLHGALWVALKTEEPIQLRARRIASRVWWAVALFTLLITIVTFRVQPHVPARLAERPWGYLFAALALAGLLLVRWFLTQRDDLRAFLSSCAYIIGMLLSVAFGLYPLVLPASTNPAYSLTVENAKAADYGLRIGLVWWIIGMILVTAYFIYTYRHFAGKVRLEDEGGY
ncbi:MAG TPA: cytochrome d ubiquinol oxidase subunit II [Candidatus Xenobia bacterium]|nr:cytochrome d ubiquinol oxidase subunit II [Candidatus Xenobia bacterium]